MADKRDLGTGTIYFHDGQWEGRIRYRDGGNKLIVRSCYALTKEECEEKLEMLKREIGLIDKHLCSSDMPFGEWCDLWNESERGKVTQSTYELRRGLIENYLKPHLGKLPLEDITTETLGRLYSHLRKSGRMVHIDEKGKGLSMATVYSLSVQVRAIFKKAVSMKLIEKNPAKSVKIQKRRYEDVLIFSPEEIREMLTIARKYDFYEVILLSLATGLARGELVALRFRDINFKTGELKVKRLFASVKGEPKIEPLSKESLYRSIYLPPEMLELLREYKKRVKSNWLFPTAYGNNDDRPRNPNDFTMKFKAIMREMGLEQAKFSSLRDTFAVNALNYGIDIKTVAYTLGTKSVRGITKRYLPLVEKKKRQAAERLEKQISSILTD